MKAFVRLKNEICYLDWANVDELAKDKDGVKYLRQDLFDRTVDLKEMKT